MEFLKTLFGNGESLTYDQLVEKIKAAKLNVVNIADGSYVSRTKFDDKVNTLTQQVTDLNGQLTQRDADMADLNTKLTAAQADATKLGEVQQSFTDLQTKYNADKQAYERKLSQQSYDFLLREKASGLKFTSPAAKRDFIREATDKDFKIDGENLLGYDDFVTKYKADRLHLLRRHPTLFFPELNRQVEKKVFSAFNSMAFVLKRKKIKTNIKNPLNG